MVRTVTLFAKFSLDYPDHPKIQGLSDAAFRAHVEMILWSHRNKTSGLINLDTWTPSQVRELQCAELLDGDILSDFGSFPRGGHDGRPSIPKAIRAAVYGRDGHRCLGCGAGHRLSLDHLIRYRHGGEDTLENLRTLCLPCNQRRG